MTYLDFLLLGVVAVSGLVAMYRGFTREVLSILSWLLAGIAGFYVANYQPDLADSLAKQFSETPQSMHLIGARIAIGAGVFLLVLIPVHLVTSHISDNVLDSRVGAIDRILGLGFGALRGFILVVIPYMFAVSFLCKGGAPVAITHGCGPGELPGWIEQARTAEPLKQTGSWLYGVFDRFRTVSPG